MEGLGRSPEKNTPIGLFVVRDPVLGQLGLPLLPRDGTDQHGGLRPDERTSPLSYLFFPSLSAGGRCGSSSAVNRGVYCSNVRSQVS